MKKIIIALLVVLSVFALVSCSSSEPTVTAQTLTMSTNGAEAASWSTKLAYNKANYGVWYKTTDGKYVAVYSGTAAESTGTVLKDAAGKEIGNLAYKVKDITNGSGTETVYVGKEVTLSVFGDASNSGTWTGEIAVAVTAVSDTQLSGIVAKYNLTYTNTVEVGASLDLGNIKLAVGGNNTEYTVDEDKLSELYKVLYLPETYANVQKVYVSTEKLAKSLKGKTLNDLAIFEQLNGGYVYVKNIEIASTTPPSITIDDAADDEALGKVYMLTGGYPQGANVLEADGIIFGFVLNDLRGESYKQFVDYDYSAKFVLASVKINEKGEKVIDGDIVANGSITGDLEPRKTFKTAGSTTFKGIEVSDTNENVGLFYINSKGKYESLTKYYLGYTKPDALAIGKVTEVQALSGDLERSLTVTFTREDAPGECDVRSFGYIAETLKVYLCSYIDADVQSTIKVIDSFDMYFENELAGNIILLDNADSATTKSNIAYYWFRDCDGTNPIGNYKLWVYDTWTDASAPKWVNLTESEANVYTTNVVIKTASAIYTATLKVEYAKTTDGFEEDDQAAKITLTAVGSTGNAEKNGVFYLKFNQGTSNADLNKAATTKLALDCTVKKADN